MERPWGRGPPCSGDCPEPAKAGPPTLLWGAREPEPPSGTVPQLTVPHLHVPLPQERADSGDPLPRGDQLKACFRDSSQGLLLPCPAPPVGGRDGLGEKPKCWDTCPQAEATLTWKGRRWKATGPGARVSAGASLTLSPGAISSSGNSRSFLSGRSEGPGPEPFVVRKHQK